MLLFGLFGCITITNPLAIDDDGDGVTEFEGDCDDGDPNVTFVEDDADCDGVLSGDDCDDRDPSMPNSDQDCDGVLTSEDCDDNDFTLLAQSNDQDCDGVLTVDDCNDSNSNTINDMDCDGVLSGDDCDDGDPSTVNDMDCDGVLSADDCDDGDSNSTIVSEDNDCDGVLSGGDCDDNDPSLLFIVYDNDCDGVLSGDDCDDGDPSSTVVSEDGDCDGVLSVDDCNDSNSNTINDMDCDGVLSADDCDDGDALSTVVSEDGDCDGVLSVDDCDDGDSSLLSVSNDGDCDGVLSVDDCDDGDPSTVDDMDCDGVLSGDDCDDGDPLSTVVSEDGDCDGVLSADDCDDGDAFLALCLDAGGGETIEFAFIPSGTDPLGRYTLTNDFYLMTTEVTQGMFQQIMGYDSRTGKSTAYGDGVDFPAYYASWHMAAAFANAVTQRHNTVNGTSLQNCYSCSGSGTSVSCSEVGDPYQCTGYVLPTEAEWEYAARSGTTSAFWTGDGPNLGGTYTSTGCGNGINDTANRIQDGVTNPALSDYAWFCGNRYDSTYSNTSKPVGLKLPNGFGLYDMIGNLYEWTGDDYFCPYPQSTTDPRCVWGSDRVLRGGSWSSFPYYMRASDRYTFYSPADRDSYFGFRIGLHP